MKNDIWKAINDLPPEQVMKNKLSFVIFMTQNEKVAVDFDKYFKSNIKELKDLFVEGVEAGSKPALLLSLNDFVIMTYMIDNNIEPPPIEIHEQTMKMNEFGEMEELSEMDELELEEEEEQGEILPPIQTTDDQREIEEKFKDENVKSAIDDLFDELDKGEN